MECSLPKIPNQFSNIGFYFHIPFCPHICPYCDFIKTSRFTKNDIDAYFEQLQRQLIFWLNNFFDNPFIKSSTHCTVYFGGGTPSLFPAKYYKPLLKILSEKFILEEVTIETNPFTNKINFISDYRDIGFDRVTLGAQSLCPEILKFLGRKHSQKDIFNNIIWLKESGFKQIQVDLIYGIKSSRSISITEEIKQIVSAGATGISAYGLTLESRTLFGKSKKILTDEDIAVDEYQKILKTCKSLGLNQIETSNFSFFPAKHNQIYWYGYPYFGIGPGAHGLLPPTEDNPSGIRYQVGQINEEISPGNDKLSFDSYEDCRQNFQIIYELPRTKTQELSELIFTLLRTENGISLTWLSEKILLPKNEIIQKLTNSSVLMRALDNNHIKLLDDSLIIDSNEKIRGDMWAEKLMTHVLSLISL